MWLFLTARLRRWLLMAIAVPALLGLVRFLRVRLEQRTGPNTRTRTLARLEHLALGETAQRSHHRANDN